MKLFSKFAYIDAQLTHHFSKFLPKKRLLHFFGLPTRSQHIYDMFGLNLFAIFFNITLQLHQTSGFR